jgi:hypothetical protein
MINQPNPPHKLLCKLFTHHGSPHIRVKNCNHFLMVEELHVEYDPFLKFLQYLNPLIMVFFSVVCVMHCHYHQTRWWDLGQILEQVRLNDIEKCLLLLLSLIHLRVDIKMSKQVYYFEEWLILLRLNNLQSRNYLVLTYHQHFLKYKVQTLHHIMDCLFLKLLLGF